MNILDVTSGIIVQQVNCQGKMGSGLAAQIRVKWPVVYYDYITHGQDYSLGDVQLVQIDDGLVVANLFGQNGYGHAGVFTDYHALTRGFAFLDAVYPDDPIYAPQGIGCGLGGGDWTVVKDLIAMTCPRAWIVALDRPQPYRVAACE